MITPRYESNLESKIRAFKGLFKSPSGEGKEVTMLSKTFSIFKPVLAETGIASVGSIPKVSISS